MPCCCAFGCRNRQGEGKRFFCLPAGKNDIQRRKAWIDRIGRAHFDEVAKNARLCEDHFSEDQFEPLILQNSGIKKLKRNAVPNIFVHWKQPITVQYEDVHSSWCTKENKIHLFVCLLEWCCNAFTMCSFFSPALPAFLPHQRSHVFCYCMTVMFQLRVNPCIRLGDVICAGISLVLHALLYAQTILHVAVNKKKYFSSSISFFILVVLAKIIPVPAVCWLCPPCPMRVWQVQFCIVLTFSQHVHQILLMLVQALQLVNCV